MLDDDYLPSRLITLSDHWEAINRPDPLDALWLLGRYVVRVGVYTGRFPDASAAYCAALDAWSESGPTIASMVEALNALAGTSYTTEGALASLAAGAAVAIGEDPIDPVGDWDGAAREVAFCGTLIEGLERRDIHTMN